MLEQRDFGSSPEMGLTRTWYFDHETGAVTIETTQDVEALVGDNKAEYASIDERAAWDDGFSRVASVPMNVFMELQRTGIADDRKALKKFLNDPDNRYFRTRPGRV